MYVYLQHFETERKHEEGIKKYRIHFLLRRAVQVAITAGLDMRMD